MTGAYSEDQLVQQTMANYLEDQLGWRSVYAYNQEDFGPQSLLGRSSDREIVLVRILREKLVELNKGLPAEAYDDAVRQITQTDASGTILATNRDKYALLLDGVQVGFTDSDGQRTKMRLRVFDFNDHTQNDFLCVRELWIRGDLYRKRADVVGFVNGIPLLFCECKNLNRSLKAAFEENYSDYRDTVPHLFHHNAIVMFANGEEAKTGSITGTWEHFHEWKRLDEDEVGVVGMETLLKGICDRRNFLDLFENFILFDDSSGKTIKIVGRNHQFLGVNRALVSVADRKAREGRLGVFWHTQGAGKSYSMVFFTRKVHRKLGGNFTFVMLTDREDLDTQLYKTFAGCGVVDHDQDPCRAGSGDNLKGLLSQHKSYVFSLIQKFNQIVDPDEGYTSRDDVIVITDEAHRTQYGTLALNMRNALPRASYIGFTGTPLFSDDEITKQVFGDYVSTYDFQRAVEDKATLPLYYDARGDKLGVALGDVNDRIAAKLDELSEEIDEDQNVRERLERELSRDYHVITADSRLEQVAKDFVEHYSTGWEAGKAMFVCIDKVTCVRMYNLIQKHWKETIKQLRKESEAEFAVTNQPTDTNAKLKWMVETEMAVVVSEEQGEVDKFRKWDLDIKPHRRLIKDGINLPESMRDLPKFRGRQRMELEDAFKEEEHPLRVAIVCAMWLTGFNVPSLSTLYLDKPLKAHTLMQAIARANRVHEGKNNGMIVDYCGILKHLRKALSTFAGATVSGEGSDDSGNEPARPEEELLGELEETIAMVRAFLEERAAPLDTIIQSLPATFARNAAIIACKEAVNENDKTRKRFEIACREVFKKFKACINVSGVNTFREDRDAINVIYKSLQRDREQADISGIIQQLHQVVDEAIETQVTPVVEDHGPYDISKIDFDLLRREFSKSKRQRTAVQNLKETIEKRLAALLRQNPLRTDFQKRYEEIVDEYNREKDRVTIERTFEALLKLVQELGEEDSRAVREGLNEETLAIFDLLKRSTLDADEIQEIKDVAVALLAELKRKIADINQWRQRESTRDAIRLTIHDFLWSDRTGLPPDAYDESDIEEKTDAVFQHVYRAYPRVPSPIYDTQSA